MTLREIYFTMVNPLAVRSRFMQSIHSAASDDEDNLDANDVTEEKTRSGIQSIEVGFRLLDVLTNEPRAMMLRDLAQRAGMSLAKTQRYLVSFPRLGVVAQDPAVGLL